LDQANVELNEEKKFAQQKEEEAVQQMDTTLDALGDLLLEIQTELEDAPGGLAVRKRVLKMAQERLEKLTSMPSRSEVVQRRRMLAHMQLGEIAQALADYPKAHQEFLVAYDIAKRALEAYPTSDKARLNIHQMGMKVGGVELYRLKKLDDAR